jgi:hypothetical protein
MCKVTVSEVVVVGELTGGFVHAVRAAADGAIPSYESQGLGHGSPLPAGSTRDAGPESLWHGQRPGLERFRACLQATANSAGMLALAGNLVRQPSKPRHVPETGS